MYDTVVCTYLMTSIRQNHNFMVGYYPQQSKQIIMNSVFQWTIDSNY